MALVLAGGGLAGAATSNNICFPQPKFVYGGDPDFKSLTADNVTRWTGGAGFGWASGGPTDDSYETALIDKAADPLHPEVWSQQLLFGFMRQSKISFVDPSEGVRFGFSYKYTDHGGTTHTAQQIIHIAFDPGGHSSSWNSKPTACTAASTGVCYNDPNGNAALFVNFQPSVVEILAQTDDGKVARWPASADITQWVKDNTRVWIFGDATSSPTQYWWRMHVATPVRRTSTGATAPDPTVTDSWTSPSIFLDEAAFDTSPTTKEAPKFWVDFVTSITDTPMFNYLPYPDSADLSPAKAGTNRDTTFHVPAALYWGTGETGSPRGAALAPGELQCSGGGITIAASTADQAVWHSDIWNTTAGVNSAGLFNDGGQLYMVDGTGALKANVLAVTATNTSPTPVSPSALGANFLIAPYGSQAIGTIWSPLVTGGNDYTCSGSGTKNQGTCQPVPVNVTSVIPATPNSAGWVTNAATMQPQLELDMTGTGWKPSADYMCAVQTSDTGGAWYFQDPQQAVQCSTTKAIYRPDGTVPNGLGLPGHQCIQAQLVANTSDVQFATKSAFRNMHQGVASLHRETATIDTRGLTKVKGQTYHDIYLYVETHNMPYRVDAGSTPVTYNQAMGFFNYCSGNVEIGVKRGERANPCPPGDWGNSPAPSDDFFTRYMPTFVVKAYADVGVRYKTPDGRSVPVMQRLTSFGQFITHDVATEGPVYGWDAGLEPVAGTTFQKIGPNTYRLRIPNDGAGQVVTHVEPLPSKRPVCTGTVNMNIVQLLQAIAPLITVSPEDAGEINALIDSLQIQCVDLKHFLDTIVGKNWGTWTSWVQFLVSEVEAAAGCNCK